MGCRNGCSSFSRSCYPFVESHPYPKGIICCLPPSDAVFRFVSRNNRNGKCRNFYFFFFNNFLELFRQVLLPQLIGIWAPADIGTSRSILILHHILQWCLDDQLGSPKKWKSHHLGQHSRHVRFSCVS